MNKILLNKNKNKDSVNKDSILKINLDNTNRILPIGKINKVLNVNEQFNLEQNSSNKYRIITTINTLFSNVLFNTTGANSWSSFMGDKFRDRSYPKNGIDLDEIEDLTYNESIKNNLKNKDGWFGYFNPDLFLNDTCSFIDMEPNRDLFSLTPKNNIKNWDFTITYPYKNKGGYLVDGGLLVSDVKDVLISGKNMSCLGLPIKHNLNQGDQIIITGLTPSIYNGVYNVIKLGLDNGDLKDFYFSIDLDSSLFSSAGDLRVSRLVYGKKSDYYYRWFKKIKTISNSTIDEDDYNIYNLAFSQNIFNDKINQIIVNEDIDVTDLTDNFGRPISEFFLTFIKKNNNGFSNIKSGVYVPYYTNSLNSNIPDIDLVTNDSLNSNENVEDSVLISNDEFFGDIIEYNSFELIETVLADSNHRFNTLNRETGGILVDPLDNSIIDLGKRQEGYKYKPYYKIKIREFSNYIEQGDITTIGIPDYAEDLLDGRFIWRDLLDINLSNFKYPFLNGCHYIHNNINLYLKRQDPRGINNLFYGNFPSDIIAETLNNDLLIKQINNEC